MTIGCNQIVDCILKNCDNMVQGIKDTVYFINHEHVDKDNCTFDPENPLLLTQLVLKTVSPAAYAYCVSGYNQSNEHSVAMVKRRYQKVWDHNLIFRVFDNTPEVKAWVNDVANSRFLVIIENNYNKAGLGRTVYEVLGWDMGLELNAAERNPNDEEMMGAWLLTAGCSDSLKESLPPLTLFVTSIELTRAAVGSLLAPCCPDELTPEPT